MQEQYIISCQVWEWYGDEDHIGDPAYGRHKAKGGTEFIFEADRAALYDEPKLLQDFNDKYNRSDSFFRHEAKSVDYYYAPEKAQFINGEIVIGY